VILLIDTVNCVGLCGGEGTLNPPSPPKNSGGHLKIVVAVRVTGIKVARSLLRARKYQNLVSMSTRLRVRGGGHIMCIVMQEVNLRKGKGKIIPLQARCGPEGG